MFIIVCSSLFTYVYQFLLVFIYIHHSLLLFNYVY